jgi:hypothetical protein
MQNSQKNEFWKGKFDSIHSTFKSQIYCTSGKLIEGYSKGLYSREHQDKIVCLEKWIIRLYGKGYFNPEKIIRLEFYLKSFIDSDNKLLFTLYPDKFTMSNEEKYSTDKRLIYFLNKFYKEIQTGKQEVNKLIHNPVYKSEESIFDSKIKRFKNEFELMDFIITKKNEGFEPALLLNYASKYREYHF